MGRLDAESLSKQEKQSIIVVLDDVRSMLNVGSAFRTSDAFRIEKLLLLGITGRPPHREISKTALGATETVNWEYSDQKRETLEGLKAEGYKLVAIEQTEPSTHLQDFGFNGKEKYALIFGNEAFGVSEEVLDLCDSCIEIPQLGAKHSLNVSVSLGVVLWELSARLEAFSRFA